MEEELKRDQNHITVLGGVTDDSTQAVTMLRVDPTTKRLLVSAVGGPPGSGTVTSVSVATANGISGTVATPTSTPAITLDISALDATKIADGTISNTEFQYLNGVSSAIQTQLDAKIPGTRTVNGKALSGNITLSLASADFSSQGTTTTVLHGNAAGNPSWGAVVEADITLADNTTNNVSTSKHGFAPKGDGSTTKFLNANGAYSIPTAAGTISITISDLQTAIAGSTLSAGSLYVITDSTQSPAIYVFAETTSTIAESGQAFFWNADYQGVGNYSGVAGFGAALGQWNPIIETITVDYSSLAGGTFARGNTITGTSGKTAVVISDNGVNQLTCYMTTGTGQFPTTDAINNGSGVTADIDTVTGTTINNGDVVVWSPDGDTARHYKVIDKTKFNGTDPTTNTTAYGSALTKSATNGYLGVIDSIGYDLQDFSGGTTHDWITYRQDRNDNLLRTSWGFEQQYMLGENIMNLFQWGNDRVSGNTPDQAYVTIRNLYGYFKNNYVLSGGISINLSTATGQFYQNITNNQFVFTGANFAGIYYGNYGHGQDTTFTGTFTTTGTIYGNEFSNGSITDGTGYVNSFVRNRVLYGSHTLTSYGTLGDKIFAGSESVVDDVYGVGWNGNLTVPTKNALYDKIETLVGGAISGSGVDNHIMRWDGTTNAQNSGIIVGDITSRNAILDISLLDSTDKTFTFPNFTGTLVLTTGAQTLSSKTLDEPTIVNDGVIKDTNGNEYLQFKLVASAVNQIGIRNAATGTNPTLMGLGGDTNVGINLLTQGTGTVNLSGNTNQQGRLQFYEITSGGTNKIELTTASTLASDFVITLPSLTGNVVLNTTTATDNAIARFDSTTGSLVQNSAVIIDDAGAVTGVTTINGFSPTYSGADKIVAASGGDYTKMSTAVGASALTYWQVSGTITETVKITPATSSIAIHLSSGTTIQNNGATLTTLFSPSTTGLSRTEIHGGKYLQTNATAQGVCFNISDMPNTWISDLRIEEYGTAILMTDAASTSFYSQVSNVQIFNCNNGVIVNGTLANANMWTNVRIRPKAAGAGVAFTLDNARGNGLYNVDMEPATAAGITGFLATSTSRDNSLYNPWIENNNIGVQIDAGANCINFFGGTITGSATIDIVDNGTNTLMLGVNKTGTKIYRLPKLTDIQGLDLLTFTETASAVNNLKIANAATANTPTLSASGTDTNIGITYTTKGTGKHTFTQGAVVGAIQDKAGEVYNVKAYGALGDNSTDDTAAIQSAIDAMPVNGATLYFPAGTYRVNSAALDSIPSGSVVMGAGRGASWIRSTTGAHNLFEFEDGKLYLTFKSLRFSVHSTGGHVFAPLGTFSQGYFQDVWITQGNPAKSIWKQLDYGYYYNSWQDSYCYHDGATSVPAFDFTSATGAFFNANSFRRLTLEATSSHASYFFDFNTTSATEQLYTNYFTDITTEILNGGVVRARGANGFVFRNIDMYDFTTTVNSLFYIGKGTTGNITSRNNTFENINRVGGTLGASKYDIELESSKATDTTFINVIKSTNSGCVVELNSNANAVIIGCRGTTFNNQAATAFKVAAGVVTAASAGIGIAPTATSYATFGGSTTAISSFNLPTGSAPSAPVDGDVWREDNTNTGLKIRINGVTKTITVS